MALISVSLGLVAWDLLALCFAIPFFIMFARWKVVELSKRDSKFMCNVNDNALNSFRSKPFHS